MSTIRATIALAMAMVLSGPVSAWAQTPETGFLDRSVVVEGTEYRYQIYVPREHQRSASLPVILALHGARSRGSDGLLQTNNGLAEAIRLNVDRFPAIAVFPQSPVAGPGWQELGGRIALAALDRTLAEFRTDSSRIYLTGFSQGGNGSWYLAYHHPERFAAVLAVCGWIEERRGTTSGALYPAIPPSSSPDPFVAVAERVSRIPIWIFHGDADSRVPVEQSRRMAAALQALGADVQYTELPGVGHNAWDTAYGREDVAAWLFEQLLR